MIPQFFNKNYRLDLRRFYVAYMPLCIFWPYWAFETIGILSSSNISPLVFFLACAVLKWDFNDTSTEWNYWERKSLWSTILFVYDWPLKITVLKIVIDATIASRPSCRRLLLSQEKSIWSYPWRASQGAKRWQRGKERDKVANLSRHAVRQGARLPGEQMGKRTSEYRFTGQLTQATLSIGWFLPVWRLNAISPYNNIVAWLFCSKREGQRDERGHIVSGFS